MNDTPATPPASDPVLVEVMGAALSSLVEEMGETLVRAAYSSNIKERRDCTAGLFDAEGHMLAQAEQASPIHLGSLIGVVAAVLERFPREDIRPGDTFLSNDPYSGGGSHLPDMVLVTPVFADGRLTAWAANLAHHADFGDRGHAHIFQEGIRIPPVRFARDGEIVDDVFQLVLTNCQVPAERRADFRAQLAANRLAVTRYGELVERYGRETMLATAAALLDYTERRTRAAIAEVPDGTYEFNDRFDCPELADTELELRVRITVAGEELHFDFTGNPGQVRASVNMVRTALYATVYYAVKTLVDPDIPSNAGLHRPIRIDAPLGTIVNCREPAAVNGRTETCQRVVDLVHGALAPAVPERVTAAANGANTGVHFSGYDHARGRYFVYLETIGGGSGARAGKDGLDGVQVHVTNTSNLPVEALETEYPLVVEAYELVPDSGGPGRTRGGMGIRRTVRVEASAPGADTGAGGSDTEEEGVQFWLDTSRLRSRPWGLFGGLPGSSARVELSEGARPVVGGHTVLRPGDRVSVVTAGAGGYGDPAERDPARIERDLREGVATPDEARRAYGPRATGTDG
ncbi:hydantoinase B/oxoprolinase family protein [Streptomyces albus subsp. chlorinus]|uniref:hydantoinase B/oxoprolinase family protein n=1 Tax=Streptomyces albus TaxID=1888 RepID=UPI0015703345|nr:hydantoinase B/oxoprolinase family protein [Streptomyces albus]NSC19996.1 hydantoinase B/oxoprolinase family protein [Streptomyces albus subsp. chlorinus]